MDTEAEVTPLLTCGLLSLKENLPPKMLLNDRLCQTSMVFSEVASLHIYQH